MSIEILSPPPKEIERKFLVKIDALPEGILDAAEKCRITQVYTAINDDGSETRVRRSRNIDTGEIAYTRTSKSSGEVSREEIEETITEAEYLEEASKGVEGHSPVEKVRYKIPYGFEGKEYTIEFDVYEGRLGGMVVAEVEFLTQEEADRFRGPIWFGEDVSKNKEYKNKNLAKEGIPKGYATDIALAGMTLVVSGSDGDLRIVMPKSGR